MASTNSPVDGGRIPLGIDKIPIRVYFAILVNVAERFSYYGLTVPFRKKIDFSHYPCQMFQYR